MNNKPGFTTPAQDDDDDDLWVDSLDSLDAPGSARRVASATGPRARRALRRAWQASGIVTAIALLAVVVGVLAPHLPRAPRLRAKVPYIALVASLDISSCLVGASWSPDGKLIAAVESSNCNAPYAPPAGAKPNLLIFDAATGKQTQTYALDAAVYAAVAQTGLKLDATSPVDISYFETNWSPDGSQLQVGFGVYGETASFLGAALVTLTGAQRGHITALLEQPDAASAMPGNGFDPIPVVRWDVVTGAHTIIYLAPALAYHWLPNDVLVADDLLPGSGKASAPSATPPRGNPIGGQSFSMWQSATISPVTATSCGGNGATTQPLPQPYALLMLTTSAWSPDGRYLLDVFVQARLPTNAGHPAAATSQFSPCDSGPGPEQLPLAPFHDNGMRAALRLLDQQGGNQLTLAWSPDSRRLAVTTFDFAQNAGSLMIYNCASGLRAQQFNGSDFEASVAQYGLAQSPIWSPDGHSLLVTISRPLPQLVILGPKALGV